MEPFKRSRDPPPKGSDMDQDEDTAFADNYAERDQAKALREQARAGGLRFEAYLTGDQADWQLERIERGMFADPSEAVFAIVKNFIDMEPHPDLRDELLRRILDASIKRGVEDAEAGGVRGGGEVFDEQPSQTAAPRHPPARWAKDAR